MNLRKSCIVIAAAALIPAGALAADDSAPAQPSQPQASDPYLELSKQVQERLRALGFYDGPVNGDIGPNTQAALAQFQLSVPLPASGSLDDATLAALGVERPTAASAGASMEPGTDERRLGGSCDSMVGPDKERCVQQGGTVEASANATSGASAPATPKGN